MVQLTAIKVNLGKAIEKKLKKIDDAQTMLAIHNTLAKRCDPYVPFLEGPLSQTNYVNSQGVHYIQPYARRQYFGVDFHHTTDFHPLASAKWDKAMMRDKGDEFIVEVKAIIKRRMNKL